MTHELFLIKGKTKAELIGGDKAKIKEGLPKGPQRQPRPQKVAVHDFQRDFHIARVNVREFAGVNWHLRPDLYTWGRIPASYCSMNTVRPTSWPRDQKLPLPEFWPSKAIPDIGIQFATRT